MKLAGLSYCYKNSPVSGILKIWPFNFVAQIETSDREFV